MKLLLLLFLACLASLMGCSINDKSKPPVKPGGKDVVLQPEVASPIPSGLATSRDQPISPKMTQTCQTVVQDPDGWSHLRTSPVVENGNILRKLPNGTVLIVTKQNGNWLEISSPAKGWISTSRTSQICNSAISKNSEKHSSPKKNLSSLSKLTQEQVQQLSMLEGIPFSSALGSGNFKSVVPRYVPDGFLPTVKTNNDDDARTLSYSVSYNNNKNECFTVTGSIPMAGDPSSDNPPFKVYSIGLGEILVEYIEFDQLSDRHFIKTKDVFHNKQEYLFSSPIVFRYNTDVRQATCKPIEEQEAIKVIESLDYAF
jgi:hypothetical protein